MRKSLLLPLVFAIGLSAQTPPNAPTPGNPPAPSELKAYLALTDQQVTQLQQLGREEMQAVMALSQQIRTKQQALDAALSAPGATAAVVGQLLLDIQALRTQSTQVRQRYETQAVGLLSQDQRTRLQGLVTAQSLQPAIHQAERLNLLPGGNGGPGIGPRGFGGAGPMLFDPTRFSRGQ